MAEILELILSITTEQLGEGHPLDAVADPDPADPSTTRAGRAYVTADDETLRQVLDAVSSVRREP